MDNDEVPWLIFVDFHKAFNVIDHNLTRWTDAKKYGHSGMTSFQFLFRMKFSLWYKILFQYHKYWKWNRKFYSLVWAEHAYMTWHKIHASQNTLRLSHSVLLCECNVDFTLVQNWFQNESHSVSYKRCHSPGWILIHLRTNFTNDISTASPCPVAFDQLGLVYSRKTQYKMVFFLPKKSKKGDKIVITGSGPTVTKTITCAEIIKRKFKVSSQRAITLYAWVTKSIIIICAPR